MARPIVTWAWLAGFTDGDGYIGITIPSSNSKGVSQTSKVRISWNQKASASMVLDEIAKFLTKELGTSAKARSLTKKGHKYPQAGLYYSAKRDVRLILEALVPHLVLKQEAALRVLAEIQRKEKLREQKGKYYLNGNNGGWPIKRRQQEVVNGNR